MSNFDQDWRSRFQRFGRSYETDHQVSGWSEFGLQRRVSVFWKLFRDQKLPKTSKILDVGCGAGTYVRLLGEAGYQVVGLDYSFPTLQRAKSADSQNRYRFLEGDAYCLPFPDEKFDVIISIGIFQAIEHSQRVVDELVRVLRPNGLLIVECLNGRGIAALISRMSKKARETVPRVRTYSPNIVEGWFLHSGVTLLKQEGVYLSPLGNNQFGKILDWKVAQFLLAGRGWMPLVLAHAFIFLGKKTPINP